MRRPSCSHLPCARLPLRPRAAAAWNSSVAHPLPADQDRWPQQLPLGLWQCCGYGTTAGPPCLVARVLPRCQGCLSAWYQSPADRLALLWCCRKKEREAKKFSKQVGSCHGAWTEACCQPVQLAVAECLQRCCVIGVQILAACQPRFPTAMLDCHHALVALAFAPAAAMS